MEDKQHIPTRLTKAQTRQLELHISFLYSRKRTAEIAELRKRATDGTTASLAYTTATCAKRARQVRKRKNQKPQKTKISKIPKKTKTLPTSTYTELTTSTEDHLLSTCSRSDMGINETDFQKLESFVANDDCFDKESNKPTLAEYTLTTGEQQPLDFYKTDFQQFAFSKQWTTEVQTDIPTEEQCKNTSALEGTHDQGTMNVYNTIEYTTDQVVQDTMNDRNNINVEHTDNLVVQNTMNDQKNTMNYQRNKYLEHTTDQVVQDIATIVLGSPAPVYDVRNHVIKNTVKDFAIGNFSKRVHYYKGNIYYESEEGFHPYDQEAQILHEPLPKYTRNTECKNPNHQCLFPKGKGLAKKNSRDMQNNLELKVCEEKFQEENDSDQDCERSELILTDFEVENIPFPSFLKKVPKHEVGETENPHVSAMETEIKEKRCENRPYEKTRPNNESIIENVGFENDEACTVTVTKRDNCGMTGDVKQHRRWWSCLVCGTGPEKAKRNKTKSSRRGLLQRILHVFRG